MLVCAFIDGMKAKKEKVEALDLGAEEKIKQAARSLFAKNGFAGTRTRDIAQEAGINLALLNYYFRSKEKLFELVMLEAMQDFMRSMASIVNNQAMSLEEKLEQLVQNYFQLFLVQPDLPLFVMNELKANPKRLESHLGIRKVIVGSHFFEQIKKRTPKKVNPFHFLMNTMALTVFPFLASPMLKIIGNMNESEYLALLEERKKKIPQWILAQLLPAKS